MPGGAETSMPDHDLCVWFPIEGSEASARGENSWAGGLWSCTVACGERHSLALCLPRRHAPLPDRFSSAAEPPAESPAATLSEFPVAVSEDALGTPDGPGSPGAVAGVHNPRGVAKGGCASGPDAMLAGRALGISAVMLTLRALRALREEYELPARAFAADADPVCAGWKLGKVVGNAEVAILVCGELLHKMTSVLSSGHPNAAIEREVHVLETKLHALTSYVINIPEALGAIRSEAHALRFAAFLRTVNGPLAVLVNSSSPPGDSSAHLNGSIAPRGLHHRAAAALLFHPLAPPLRTWGVGAAGGVGAVQLACAAAPGTIRAALLLLLEEEEGVERRLGQSLGMLKDASEYIDSANTAKKAAGVEAAGRALSQAEAGRKSYLAAPRFIGNVMARVVGLEVFGSFGAVGVAVYTGTIPAWGFIGLVWLYVCWATYQLRSEGRLKRPRVIEPSMVRNNASNLLALLGIAVEGLQLVAVSFAEGIPYDYWGLITPLYPYGIAYRLQLVAVSFAEGIPYDSSGLITPLGGHAALTLPPAGLNAFFPALLLDFRLLFRHSTDTWVGIGVLLAVPFLWLLCRAFQTPRK
ncbi:hypothetical protein T484DRAFT_1811108 [Baffinella frigidus]|nr:hypothetical protein T484DRAFT_1811108 [Cryptophyta sp. CCMP2293]